MTTGPGTSFVFLALAACAAGALFCLTTPARQGEEVEMTASGLVRLGGDQFVLVLVEKNGRRRLAVPVTHAEAAFIQGALLAPRGLAAATVEALGGRVLRASIDDARSLREFRAHLVLGSGSRELRLDASAGEALSLALQAGAAIVADPVLLQEAGISPEELRGKRARNLGGDAAPAPALGI